MFIPHVDAEGNISWTLGDKEEFPVTTNIKGPKGDEGHTPEIGIEKEGEDYFWTVDGSRIKDNTGADVKANGLPGRDGTNGTNGQDGQDGISPQLRINSKGNWEISNNNGDTWEDTNVKAQGPIGNTGPKGETGKTPKFRIVNDYWQVNYEDGSGWQDIPNGQAKGDPGQNGQPGLNGRDGRDGRDGQDGITPQLKIFDNNWYISYDNGSKWKLLGSAVGPQGPAGKSPKLVRVWGDPAIATDDRILWGYDGVPISEWTVLCYVSDLKGDTIDQVNIIDADGSLEVVMSSGKVIKATGTVLPRFEVGVVNTVEHDQNAEVIIDKTNAPRDWRFNFNLPKGRPATVSIVSEVEKLAPDAQPYVTDLNPDLSDANLKFGIPQGEKGEPGDQNIFVGCEEPEDTEMIWYDPCDESLGGYKAEDFLYESYLSIGGTLSKEDFINAWKLFPNTSAFEIKFANSFEDLGEASVDKMSKVYLVPNDVSTTNDLYIEYVVVFKDGVYSWEKWGSGTVNVDLSNYYNKEEIDAKIDQLEQQIQEFNFKWNKI